MHPTSPPAEPPCPACGAVGPGDGIDARERMFGLPGRFAYRVCDACGSAWLPRPPADAAAFYPPGYYALADDTEAALAGAAGIAARALVRSALGRGRVLAAAALAPHRRARGLATALRAMRASGALRPGARVLDVGCGAGVLVLALARAGLPDPRGVDPHAAARRFAGGGRVDPVGIAGADGAFELVTFHHSLEHVADPRAQLERARRLLAPGGRVVVRCPTTSSAAFARYGDRWVGLDAPRHLVIPSRTGMERLAARAGLRVESVRDDATAMQFWGGELYRRDVTLTDPRSRLVAPWRPAPHWARLPAWWWSTRRLNRAGRGDQASWVLAPGGG